MAMGYLEDLVGLLCSRGYGAYSGFIGDGM